MHALKTLEIDSSYFFLFIWKSTVLILPVFLPTSRVLINRVIHLIRFLLLYWKYIRMRSSIFISFCAYFICRHNPVAGSCEWLIYVPQMAYAVLTFLVYYFSLRSFVYARTSLSACAGC